MAAVKVSSAPEADPAAPGKTEPPAKEGGAAATPPAVMAVEEEEEKEEDEEERRKVYLALSLEDTRVHLNVVFIGHVDAGKSTLGGQILVLMGGVDERTIEKYQKEAKDNNRETWYMAYVMDTNDEERAKGKTVEVGRAHFATQARRYACFSACPHSYSSLMCSISSALLASAWQQDAQRPCIYVHLMVARRWAG
jgi:peptide chain release factor subunit 3